ncbi:hypothetical protein WJX84_006520 [Apatococcus fuscideae]|uniref:Methyltransferase domain-containing protein n=1 Tax=Apatococcus fuscideae TaxID=2026836 RepID=A0AAW1TE73_9CHLO
MQAPQGAALPSEELRALQAAEQGLLNCLEWAAEAVEELGKVGSSDRGLVEDRTENFLKTIKEVEGTLAASIRKQETAEFAGSDSNMTSQPAQQSTFIPDKTTTYLTKPYWDERFASEESYEWCKSFEDFGHLLRPHFTPYDSILEIGAGNSSLSSQLAAELSNSYVCSLDISQVVAEKMQEQQLEQGASIQWQVGDMLCLPFCDASLDVVIEKGALDVFLGGPAEPLDPAPVAAARNAHCSP